MECPKCHSPLIADAAFCPRCGAPIDGAPDYDEYAYEAFISYKHHKRDGALAKRIQRAIEGRRLPRDIGGNRAGERLGKCFRDEDELHSSDSLPALIEDALKHARYLIVICSPEMRASAWVAREVELFASYHGRDKILPVLAEGEPQDSFPPLLMTRLEPEGDAYVERSAEPLAADMRDGSYKHFSAEVLRLVAPIAGCGYDDLRQRERTRRLMRIAVGATAAAVVAVGFGAFALFQQTQIQANLSAALKNESEYLAEEASTILEQGDRLQAVQVALHALGDGEGSNRPYTPSARLALEEACQVYPGNYWRPVYANYEDQSASIPSIKVSEGGTYYSVMTADYDIRIYDVKSGKLSSIISSKTEEDASICSDNEFVGNTVIAAYSNGTLVAHDAATGEEFFRAAVEDEDGLPLSTDHISAAPDGSAFAVTSVNRSDPSTVHVFIFDAQTGKVKNSHVFQADAALDEYWLTTIDPFVSAFSADGTTFVQSLGNAIAVFDFASESWGTHTIDSGIVCTLLLDDNAVYTGTFSQHEQNSGYYLERYNLDDFLCVWRYYIDAISTLDISELGHIAIPAPLIERTIDHAGEQLLLTAYNDRISYLSCTDGSIVLDIPTSGEVTALACGNDGTGLAYVSDGYISTAYDPFAYQDISSLGAPFANRPPSAPSMYGSEDATYADGIEFFSRDDCEYCLLVDAAQGRTILYRYDLNQTGLPGRQEADALDAIDDADGQALRSAAGTYRAYVDSSGNQIHLIDGNSFDLIATITYEELAAQCNDTEEDPIADCFFSAEDERMFYVLLNGYALFAIDAATGEVTGGPYLFGKPYSIQTSELLCHDDELLYVSCVVDYNEPKTEAFLVHLDAHTLEEQSQDAIALTDAELFGSFYVRTLAHIGSSYVVAWSYDSQAITVLDDQTLEVLNTDISCELGDAPDGESMSLHCANNRLVLHTNNELSLYDEHLNKLWTAPLEGKRLTFRTVLSTGNVLLQTSTGEVMLLDGKTGATVATTSTLSDSDEIRRAWVSQDGHHLFAETWGDLITINLDPEAFDVESYVRCGIALSQDEQQVLVHDNYDAYILPTYTTDELIDYAQGLIEGHELTREQQRRYHIE